MLLAATSLITRLAGPKALLGIVAALVVLMGLLAWQWRAAERDLASIEHQINTLRADRERAELIITEQRAEIAAFDEAIRAQREREREARERAAEAEQRLRDLEQSDAAVKDWSDSAVPDGVRHWLREPADSD